MSVDGLVVFTKLSANSLRNTNVVVSIAYLV